MHFLALASELVVLDTSPMWMGGKSVVLTSIAWYPEMYTQTWGNNGKLAKVHLEYLYEYAMSLGTT